jgi:hypothetical protein
MLEFESSLGPAAVKVKRLPASRHERRRIRSLPPLAENTGLPLAEVYRIVQAEAESRL